MSDERAPGECREVASIEEADLLFGDREYGGRVLAVGDTADLLCQKVILASIGRLASIDLLDQAYAPSAGLLERIFMERPRNCGKDLLLDEIEARFSPYLPRPRYRPPSKRIAVHNKKRDAQKAQRKARLVTKRAAR